MDTGPSSSQFPPSDIERVQVLAKLIRARRAELNTIAGARKFTAEEEREAFVLRELWDDWLLEGADR